MTIKKPVVCLSLSQPLFDEISQAAIAHEATICEEIRHIIEGALKLEKRRKQSRECMRNARKNAAEICSQSANIVLTKETEEGKEREKEEYSPQTPYKEKEGENREEEKEKSLSSPSRARTCERSGKRMVSVPLFRVVRVCRFQKKPTFRFRGGCECGGVEGSTEQVVSKVAVFKTTAA